MTITVHNTNDLMEYLVGRALEKNDLLNFLVEQSNQHKDWFSFKTQKITAIVLSHEIAKRHADTMTPMQAVQYATDLNDYIYHTVIRSR